VTPRNQDSYYSYSSGASLSGNPKYTPMYERYLSEKVKHKNVILFYRIGDFYEVFNEDAKTVSKVLDLTLVSRDVGAGRVPMCGIPCYAAERYIPQITKKGYKVAYADNNKKT